MSVRFAQCSINDLYFGVTSIPCFHACRVCSSARKRLEPLEQKGL